MNIKLIRLNSTHKALLFEMMEEWSAVENKIIPSAINRADYHNFEYYLTKLDNGGRDNLIPDTTYFGFDIDQEMLVGAVNIRHDLNEALLAHGGHIGLGVRPSLRNKGIGTKLIKLALEECKKLNINKVLMTCDKSNIASSKAIINNNGMLADETLFIDKIIQRYWINN